MGGGAGVKRLRKDIPAPLFKVLKGAIQRRGVELPERCSGRELKWRKLRGRFGFQMILGYYVLFSTLICKCYEWSPHVFIPHYVDIAQYMVC